MQLTRAADYAARVMIELAGMPADTLTSRATLACRVEVPEQFLSKILQVLVRSGLVRSQRGASGGFKLGRPASELTLLDVIEAIEGRLFLNRCLDLSEGCDRHTWCAAHHLWVEAQSAMVNVLRKRSLLELAQLSAERRGASASAPRCVLEPPKPPGGGLRVWS
jgi:Rrf2 family protein